MGDRGVGRRHRWAIRRGQESRLRSRCLRSRRQLKSSLEANIRENTPASLKSGSRMARIVPRGYRTSRSAPAWLPRGTLFNTTRWLSKIGSVP